MRVDTHQHYWRYRAQDYAWIGTDMPVLRRDCLPADVQPALRAAGIDAVLAVQARDAEAETDALLRLAATHAVIRGVVGWVDLRGSDLAGRLERWQDQPLLKGMRHIVQDEADVAAWAGDAAVRRGMRLLQRRGLCFDVLVHGHQLAAVYDFCADHDAHSLVLDHLGKPALDAAARGGEAQALWLREFGRLAALPHLCCKLSGLATQTGHGAPLTELDHALILECFDRALELFGPRRLMFGSDWPVCLLAAPFGEVHGLAEGWARSRLSAGEQDDFWGGNAVRCYALDAGEASAPPPH